MRTTVKSGHLVLVDVDCHTGATGGSASADAWAIGRERPAFECLLQQQNGRRAVQVGTFAPTRYDNMAAQNLESTSLSYARDYESK